MKITVSGEVKEVQFDLTVAELIKQENVETPEYISVSVNISETVCPFVRCATLKSKISPLKSFKVKIKDVFVNRKKR